MAERSEVPTLSEDKARLLRALSGFTDFVETKRVYAAAFGRATLPGAQSAANLLRLLADAGMVKRQIVGAQRKWMLSDLGRAAYEAHKARGGNG